jgi:hypothetical protein
VTVSNCAGRSPTFDFWPSGVLVRDDGHRLRGVQGDAGPAGGLGAACLSWYKPTPGPTLNDARIAPTLHFALRRNEDNGRD